MRPRPQNKAPFKRGDRAPFKKEGRPFEAKRSNNPKFADAKPEGFKPDRPKFDKPKFDGPRTDRPKFDKPKFDGPKFDPAGKAKKKHHKGPARP